MSDSRIVTALEIGTSKMQAFIGEIIDASKIRFIGRGACDSQGVKKGDVIRIRDAVESAQRAIALADSKAHVSSSSVCLAISGTGLRGFRNLGSACVASSDSIVQKSDVERAREDAMSKAPAEGRIYINMFSNGYRIDDDPTFVKDPIGKKGSRVYADFWMTHCDAEKVGEAIRIVESLNLSVDYMVTSGVASGLVITSPEQRENGTLVVDIGCGTTDYAFFKHGRPIQAGAIPVGGEHITNDLSFGLRMSRKNAERIKKYYGKAMLSEDEKNDKIWATGDMQIGDKTIRLSAINKIVRARLEELFLILRSELDEFFATGEVKEIVFSGGSAKLKGLCELASAIFGIPAFIGSFDPEIGENLSRPEYATGLGLLDFARREIAREAKTRKSFFGKIFGHD